VHLVHQITPATRIASIKYCTVHGSLFPYLSTCTLSNKEAEFGPYRERAAYGAPKKLQLSICRVAPYPHRATAASLGAEPQAWNRQFLKVDSPADVCVYNGNRI